MADDTLPADIATRIDLLCAEGDSLAASGQAKDAFQKYSSALNLLPEPAENWEAATWILAAIGDLYFSVKKIERAAQAFGDAVRCPGGLGNPFIHLRLGQCHFEAGEMDIAADELTRAYMGGGTEIFQTEDAKYFTFLKQRIAITEA